jgi:hypothetical protein
VGSAAASYLQLVFNNGTSYTVTDYWRVDDQLHFITVEEGGTKFVPHTVPFDDLDVERTKDRATAEGFRFLIRDKPIEQWLEDRTQEGETRRETEKKGSYPRAKTPRAHHRGYGSPTASFFRSGLAAEGDVVV